jgi:hypothetical protein
MIFCVLEGIDQNDEFIKMMLALNRFGQFVVSTG